MYYFRQTLQLHENESVKYVGAGEVHEDQFGECSGNGAHVIEVAAWSTLPFVAVITGVYDFGERIGQRAFHADPLPHTVREAEMPEECVVP